MLSTCLCQKCGATLEFDVAENMQFVECPHCHQQTRYILGTLPIGFTKNAAAAAPKETPWTIIIFLGAVLLFGLIICLADPKSGPEYAGYLIGIVIGICIYFLPTAVACQNKKRNTTAIFVLNLLAGWTFIGWVAAMVWACTKD